MNVRMHLAVFGRVALATLLGYAIGWEREFRRSPAGDRTFALVALGSAAVTALGVRDFPASAEKVIAGVVTGIGFLGAGVIFRSETGGPHGLTTAASLWAAATIGILVGATEYFVAVSSTVLVLLILEAQYLPGLRHLSGDARRERRLPNEKSPATTEDIEGGRRER
jgi:putative Mg2+ transporter-C (MgtC) family protein